MRKFWLYVYNLIFLPLVWLFFMVYSVFNSKVRQGLNGRRDLFEKLNKSLLVFSNKKKNILIHCSSLGEYQQAIPLIKELSGKNFDVVISFFSPSGYTNANPAFENCIKTYLPFDSTGFVKKFLNMIKPERIIFMRYDLWYNLMYTAITLEIPMYIANARFDTRDLTWKLPVISSFKKEIYGMLNTIFTINENDQREYSRVLSGKDTKVKLIGDSKFERVKQAGENFSQIPELKNIVKGEKKVFVIGSSWKEDEDLLLPVVDKIARNEKNVITFLVPHEPKEKKIEIIIKKIQLSTKNLRPLRYSLIRNFKNENLIIVDRMGLLMQLYSLAWISYVGGGLKSGLHNILEPTIFNMPILFSNKVKNSDEDVKLIDAGCGFVVKNQKDTYRLLRTFFSNNDYRNEVGSKCRLVFEGTDGIAKKIISYIN